MSCGHKNDNKKEEKWGGEKLTKSNRKLQRERDGKGCSGKKRKIRRKSQGEELRRIFRPSVKHYLFNIFMSTLVHYVFFSFLLGHSALSLQFGFNFSTSPFAP